MIQRRHIIRTLSSLAIVAATTALPLRYQVIAQPVPLRAAEMSPYERLVWLSQRPIGLLLHEAADHRTTIQAVQTGSTAEQSGLKPGDLLLRVGRLPAPTPIAAAEQIANAWAAGKTAIDLVVAREGLELYVPLRLRS
jgi:predicted metalloprotease with PDZ domain